MHHTLTTGNSITKQAQSIKFGMVEHSVNGHTFGVPELTVTEGDTSITVLLDSNILRWLANVTADTQEQWAAECSKNKRQAA